VLVHHCIPLCIPLCHTLKSVTFTSKFDKRSLNIQMSQVNIAEKITLQYLLQLSLVETRFTFNTQLSDTKYKTSSNCFITPTKEAMYVDISLLQN
jgi:hypothetical protein